MRQVSILYVQFIRMNQIKLFDLQMQSTNGDKSLSCLL